MACFALDMFGLDMDRQWIWSKSGNADQIYALVGQGSYCDITSLGSAALSMNPVPGVPPSYCAVAGSCHQRAKLAL
jgi:hypothetical protein